MRRHAIDALTERAFARVASGIQIPILSIPRIFTAARIAAAQATDPANVYATVEASVAATVADIRASMEAR